MSAVSPSPGRLSPGRKTPPRVSAPSAGLRTLNVSRVKCGADLVEAAQRPERTGAGVRKPPPESSVPDGNLTRGSRRNQLRRGHGSPPVLSEVFSSLALMRTPKSANGPRKEFIPPTSPHDNLPRGRKTPVNCPLCPLTTPDMLSVPDASSKPQLNFQFQPSNT